jgi:hypothetical protein
MSSLAVKHSPSGILKRQVSGPDGHYGGDSPFRGRFGTILKSMPCALASAAGAC